MVEEEEGEGRAVLGGSYKRSWFSSFHFFRVFLFQLKFFHFLLGRHSKSKRGGMMGRCRFRERVKKKRGGGG